MKLSEVEVNNPSVGEVKNPNPNVIRATHPNEAVDTTVARIHKLIMEGGMSEAKEKELQGEVNQLISNCRNYPSTTPLGHPEPVSKNIPTL